MPSSILNPHSYTYVQLEQFASCEYYPTHAANTHYTVRVIHNNNNVFYRFPSFFFLSSFGEVEDVQTTTFSFCGCRHSSNRGFWIVKWFALYGSGWIQIFVYYKHKNNGKHEIIMQLLPHYPNIGREVLVEAHSHHLPKMNTQKRTKYFYFVWICWFWCWNRVFRKMRHFPTHDDVGWWNEKKKNNNFSTFLVSVR